MHKTLSVEVKRLVVDVTKLARQAHLAEAVANSPELLTFASLVVDLVMAEHGATRVATPSGTLSHPNN